MNEWLNKLLTSIKGSWTKWTIIQKGILFGILAVIVAAVFLLFRVSSKPTVVRLFGTPITDEVARAAIITRLDRENVESSAASAGYLSVKDKPTA